MNVLQIKNDFTKIKISFYKFLRVLFVFYLTLFDCFFYSDEYKRIEKTS